MTVRSVEAIPVAYPEPNDHSRLRSVCLVKVTTEDGAVGWGECCAYFPEASRAAKALVDGLSEIVVGQDEVQTETIWRLLKKHSWWYGTGAGIASLAISGIDIALWDLKGKVLGRSVLDPLGGPVHERMPAVASIHATKASIPAMVEEIVGYLADGLQGVKVGFGKKGDAQLGFDHARDVDYVRSVREAIGPDKRLMIDLGVKNFWDVPTAIQRARAFEDYRVHWLEEPLGHDDPEGYRALRAGTSLRIGYGEREWNARGVSRIVETGTVDVVGLDPGRIEGITGFAKAAAICAQYRRQANAHNFSTAIVSAASQALSFASPACRELELQPVYGPAQKDLVDRPVWHTDGWVHRPEGPGLGIEVNEDLVNSARLDKVTHLAWGLEGRTVIVTGGAGAIGRAVCEGFAEAGARVAIVDLDPGACDRTAHDLGQGHGGFAADLRDIGRLPALVARIEAALGPPTVLVNVAGTILRNPDLLAVTEAEWDAQADVNLKALFFLCQAFAGRLIATGTPGSIVNYSSQGWMSGGFGGSVVYNATKGAVTTMTRGMARSWAGHGIRVNGVAPGLVETPMLVTPQTTPEQIAALTASIPLGRLGQPADHVGATVFLASDMAAYMTGAMVNVSGGFLMY